MALPLEALMIWVEVVIIICTIGAIAGIAMIVGGLFARKWWWCGAGIMLTVVCASIGFGALTGQYTYSIPFYTP